MRTVGTSRVHPFPAERAVHVQSPGACSPLDSRSQMLCLVSDHLHQGHSVFQRTPWGDQSLCLELNTLSEQRKDRHGPPLYSTPAGEPGALSLSPGRPASLRGAGAELAESKVLDSSDCGGPSGPRTNPRGRLRCGSDLPLPQGSGKPPYRGTRGRWLWCSSQSPRGEAAAPP